MAKVYVSSTVADLEMERRAVIDWLVKAGHQPVHSYRPASESVRDSCLDDIDGCNLYVLILGHRYGFVPEDDNPEKLSITHLEFRRAGQSNVPRVALIRTSVPDIKLSDLFDPEKAARVRAFEEEVRRAVRPAEFNTPQGLIEGLSTGVQSQLEKQASAGDRHARALSLRVDRDGRVLRVSASNQGTHIIRDIEINAIPDDEDWFERTHGPLPKLLDKCSRGVEVVYPIVGGWFWASVTQLSPNRGIVLASFETNVADYTKMDFDVFWNDHTGRQRKAHAVADVLLLEGDLPLEPRG